MIKIQLRLLYLLMPNTSPVTYTINKGPVVSHWPSFLPDAQCISVSLELCLEILSSPAFLGSLFSSFNNVPVSMSIHQYSYSSFICCCCWWLSRHRPQIIIADLIWPVGVRQLSIKDYSSLIVLFVILRVSAP